jgi:Uma2 family endonuclease
MVISTKYTHADLLAIPADNKRREILDGELLVSPSPLFFHQLIVHRFLTAFDRYLDRNPIGEILLSPLDVIFGESDVLEPDLIFVLSEHRHILQDWVRGVPDLVIEVLSPGSASMDRGPKLKACARFGVPEYWIVDPDAFTVETYGQSSTGYELVAAFGERDSVTSRLLPGFVLPVASIFAQYDNRTERE